MAKGGELGCRAHLGRLGHDFSPEPILRYSFIEIECPIWDFCVAGKKEREGRKQFRLVTVMSTERLWNSDYNQ